MGPVTGPCLASQSSFTSVLQIGGSEVVGDVPHALALAGVLQAGDVDVVELGEGGLEFGGQFASAFSTVVFNASAWIRWASSRPVKSWPTWSMPVGW